MAIKILKINDVLVGKKELREFLSKPHKHWDLIRFDVVDTKTGKTWPSDATVEGAKVKVLKQMMLDGGCDHKLLEDFEQAVRDEARREEYEGRDENY